MLFEESESRLLRCVVVPLEKLAQDAKPPGTVREGYFTGPLQGFGIVLLCQGQESLQNPNARNSPCFKHVFRPTGSVLAEKSSIFKQSDRPTFDAALLLRMNVFRQRAATTGFLSRMDGDLSHASIEDSHQSQVPTYPE